MFDYRRVYHGIPPMGNFDGGITAPQWDLRLKHIGIEGDIIFTQNHGGIISRGTSDSDVNYRGSLW